MVDEERFGRYLDSLGFQQVSQEEPLLAEIEQEALADEVPIIRRDMQQLMKVLLQLHRPASILELGTAVGFSAGLMARYNPNQACHITTVENWPPRIAAAKENFARLGIEGKVTLIEGDALESLRCTINGTYDFVFLDAAKGQYPLYLPEIKAHMHSGSVLVTDNILQDGDLLQSRYAICRRDRTIHKRMREFLELLTSDETLTTSIISVGDGVAISVMK